MQDNEYSNMNKKINALWAYLENTTKHLEAVKELANSKINILSNYANHSLEKIYNLQNKEKNYSNSHYQAIFDKNELRNGDITTVNVDGSVYGTVIDQSIGKKVYTENAEKK